MKPGRLAFRLFPLFLYIAGALWLLPGLQLNNSLERWLARDSEALSQYADFLDSFGSDALLLLSREVDTSEAGTQAFEEELKVVKDFEHVLDISPWPPPYVQHKVKPTAGYRTALIRFRPESHLNPNRMELLEGIDSIMAQTGRDYYLAGTGVVGRAINEQTQRDASQFLVIGFILLLAGLVYLVRDALAILQVFSVALAAIATLVYASVLLEVPISMAHTVIPVLILFYSTSTAMHVLAHGGNYREILAPSLWVAGTTILGFSAFLVSRIPLLQDFALLGISGMVGVVLASLWVFFPRVYPYPGNRFTRSFGKIKRPLRKYMAMAVLALFAITAPGVGMLRSEIHSLSLLDRSEKAYQDHLKTLETVGPYFPLEYTVSESVPRKELSAWARAVFELPEVGAMASFHRIPPMADLFGLGLRSRKEPDQYRITFFIPLLSTEEGKALAGRIETLGHDFFETNRPQIKGFMPVYSGMSDDLLKAFHNGMLLGFSIIFLMMILYLRNWKLILPTLVVNVVPIGAMLGAMGWLGIRLDMITIPLGCLLLGIVVDDTIHFMHAYRKHRDVDAALRYAGPGIVLTTVIITMGFSVLMASGAPPIHYFGLLSTSAILLALACDLFLLPELLRKVYPSQGTSRDPAKK
ncbi:efflux RND transporter permease subunit [Robiginitalea sediminis]|uniref:efflux RND transporter permease subunit n=1 Tax=Robiginitalea sediminis TaxID=1982593 RepID=UPI000B4B4A08|nr:hypothetical protein [Robiginitalea sediminis]